MAVPAADTIITPGPGLEPPADDDSWVTTALTRPHRLLEPLRAAGAPVVPELARQALLYLESAASGGGISTSDRDTAAIGQR